MAVVRKRYADFRADIACEKLRELHGVTIHRDVAELDDGSRTLVHARRAT